MKNKILCVYIFSLVLLAGCTTVDDPAQSDPTPTPTWTSVPIEPTNTPIPEASPEATPTFKPTPTPFPTVEEKDPNVSTAEVSEAVYTKTFEEIEELIYELNSIIKAAEYEKWLEYLTDAYIADLSDPQTLADYSQKPILKKYNIVLKDLEDYFKFVVVPSRSNVRVDDLVFMDENHIKAIMVIGDQRIILYLLEKINDHWLISVW